MKVLIHGLNFSPEVIGIGKYTSELALWLKKTGLEVHVVTAPPYYPEWIIQPPYNAWQFKKENWNGIQIIRCPLWVPRKPTGVSRIIHLLSFALSSRLALVSQLKFRPDIVICVVPTLFAASSSAWLARRSKAISWLHIQDFEVEAASNLNIIQTNRIIMRLAMHWEKFILNRFDRVSSISTQMVNRLIAKRVPEEKTVLFPNWVNTDSIYPIPQRENPIRRELGISREQCIVLYSGNMGYKQGLDQLLLVADRIKSQTNVIFVLCGNGVARPDLEKKAKYLTNIRFLDLQPIDKLNILLNAADIHILPQQPTAADLVMPSKLLGMMSSA